MPPLRKSVSLPIINFYEEESVGSEDVDAKILNEAGKGYLDEYEHVAVQLDAHENYFKHPIFKHLSEKKKNI